MQSGSRAKIRPAVLCIALVASLLAACGASSAASRAKNHPVRPPRGLLVGEITYTGGPPPAHPRPPAGGVVSVFTPAGRRVASERVHPGHRFRFSLAPGRYLVAVGSRLPRHAGHGTCLPVHVRVVARRTTNAEVDEGCGVR